MRSCSRNWASMGSGWASGTTRRSSRRHRRWCSATLTPVKSLIFDVNAAYHLSGGRLEIIIGKGNGLEQPELFGITRDQQWETIKENYRLLRRLWLEQKVTWSPSAHGIRQVPLVDAAVWPRPLQQPTPRIWHGSATSQSSVDLAAEYGDPVFSANV